MPHPPATRKPQVASKIAYALHRHQELMRALFSAKSAAVDPVFLVHVCADIVATARECFDYLAQDIVEGHILPRTSSARIQADHAAGKLKPYFPYYTSQVTRPDAVFHELVTLEPALYQALVAFADAIAAGDQIPGTLFSYKMLLDVKDMVNEKKHDKLLGVVSEADREYLISQEGTDLILPIRDQRGWASFAVQPGTRVSRVAEYRFAHNDLEVGKFCLFATKATERVIDGFYQGFFAQ